MLVKVIKARDPFMWYANMIGKLLHIERESADVYWSREPAGYINLVYKDDVEIVNYKGENTDASS